MMPETVANQVAALAAVMTRVERMIDADRTERKAESEATNKALAHDRANAEMTRSAVSAELTDIRHGQENMVKRLDKIEPVTELFTSLKSKVAGALVVFGLIGALATSGIMFFRDIILEWFR